MPQAKNKKCRATVDMPGGSTLDVAFRSNVDLYTGSVSTATGISPATTAADLALPTTPIHVLVKSGYLYKVTVSTAGTGTTPPITKCMIISNKNLNTFLNWANNTSGTTLPTGETIVRGSLRMNRMKLE